MKMYQNALFSALFFLAACQTPNSTSTEQNSTSSPISPNLIIFQNVNVIPMTNRGEVLTNQIVTIEKGKITNIVDAANIRLNNSEAQIIDGTGKYLVPGLAEMHAHIPTPQNGNDSLVRETLFLYLSQGVTTIRGMLGDPYHLKLKEQVANNEILSPRIYTSSPSMNGNSVQTPTQAREKVTQYAADGYDFLKIHPGIKLDVFEELVKTANEVGIDFAGHVPVDVGINRAIDFGYASVDHVDGYVRGLLPEGSELTPADAGFFGFDLTEAIDESLLPALAEKTAKADVWVVPTQTLMTRWLSPKSGAEMGAEPEMQYMAPSTRYAWRQGKQRLQDAPGYSQERYNDFIALRKKILQALRAAGVNILLGSDAPQVYNVPGFSILHEMEAMADAGFTPYEILESGTVHPAIYFDAKGEYGTIEPGASADFILLDANPLENISNMRHQSGVMVRGEWLPTTEIKNRLAVIAEQYVGAN